MEPFGFEKLPEVIRQIFEKIERIESIVEQLNPSDEDKDELFNIQQAADYLKVSVQSIYAKVSRLEIPVRKPGKRLYFSKQELRSWVDNSRRKTAAELINEIKQGTVVETSRMLY
ncbi:helix-turn-helix domain-containing protein [Pedobacter jeongneungensis]|uniref:helix-turn-helix domain-containing protein n=1 Tax=Pedobacter jeongneungensis TaxID=947309 RepID=UPI000468AC5E|nr:helix-turn-helix domain-containing protein [Pedobacter jeongneungensis]